MNNAYKLSWFTYKTFENDPQIEHAANSTSET